ncbi:MAG: FAD-binding oxidoreductase [Candidatus Helarchaeota archaeon]
MVIQTSLHDTVKGKLIDIVGADWVSDFPEDLLIYSYDMTEHPPGMPEYIVMPKTVEEIQAVLQVANEYKVPVVPFVTGANIGGLTIPLKGGIILDLKRMDQILRVDTDDMYMIIEPGVTFGHLRRFLDEKYPDLRYCYPMAPPFTSVAANALQDGLNNLSTAHGCMSEFINGIEAVLPMGKVVKIGTCMCFDQWWGRYPMPDLLGLFTGWQGMTGVVTKIALQLWPNRPYRGTLFFISNKLAESYETVKKVTRYGILDDLLFISTETIKLIYGVPYGQAVHLEGEPRWGSYLDFSANSPKELEAKEELIQNAFKELKKEDSKAALASFDAIAKMYGPRLADVQKLPITLKGMVEYGGLSWIGTYFTTKTETVVKAVDTAFDIIDKFGFEKCLYTRMMKDSHYFAFRFLLRFSKEKDGEIERMRSMNKELFEALFDLGAFPYKTPKWAQDLILKRTDKNWIELMQAIKRTIDPNNIMNPGRWGLD